MTAQAEAYVESLIEQLDDHTRERFAQITQMNREQRRKMGVRGSLVEILRLLVTETQVRRRLAQQGAVGSTESPPDHPS